MVHAEGSDESVELMEEEAHVACGESLHFPALTGPGVFGVNTTKRQDELVMRITEGLREDLTLVLKPSCTPLPTP